MMDIQLTKISVEKIIRQVDSLKKEINELEGAITQLRGIRTFEYHAAIKDNRASVKLLLSEYERRTDKLIKILNTEVICDKEIYDLI